MPSTHFVLFTNETAVRDEESNIARVNVFDTNFGLWGEGAWTLSLDYLFIKEGKSKLDAFAGIQISSAACRKHLYENPLVLKTISLFNTTQSFYSLASDAYIIYYPSSELLLNLTPLVEASADFDDPRLYLTTDTTVEIGAYLVKK